MTYKNSRDSSVEYVELGENLRHYSNVRFAGLTICLAVTAFLVNLVYSDNHPEQVNRLFKWAGLFVGVLFLAVDVSDMFLWTKYVRRAAELERRLGFAQYSRLPGAPQFNLWRPATIAIWLFYIGISLFWIITMVQTKASSSLADHLPNPTQEDHHAHRQDHHLS